MTESAAILKVELEPDEAALVFNNPLNSNIKTARVIKLQRKLYRKYYLSLPYIFKYLTKRLPYRISGIKEEITLVLKTLKILK